MHCNGNGCEFGASERPFDIAAEAKRLRATMDAQDGVNLFISEGAGVAEIVAAMEAAGEIALHEREGWGKRSVENLFAAIDEGASLIIFPEGNRNMGDDPLLPFKAGLYNIGRLRPDVDLVPTWVANLNNIMPKGEVVPLPLICTVTFGTPIHVGSGEEKDAFLARAAQALLDARPEDRE